MLSGVIGIVAGFGSIILTGGDATAAVILIPMGIYSLLHRDEEES